MSSSSTATANRVSFPGVVRGEAIKLAGQRASWWLVGLALLVPIAISLVYSFFSAPAATDELSELDAVIGPTTYSVGESIILLVLIGTAVGAHEYNSRSITTTMAAVPRRWPVVLAKVLLVFLLAFVVAVVVRLTAFLLAAAIVPLDMTITLATPGAISVVFGSALFEACSAALGVCFGIITRSSIGGIAATIGFLYIVPGAINLIPLQIAQSFAGTFPGPASDALLSVLPVQAGSLTYGAAAVAVTVWTLVWTAIAAAVVIRRDV